MGIRSDGCNLYLDRFRFRFRYRGHTQHVPAGRVDEERRSKIFTVTNAINTVTEGIQTFEVQRRRLKRFSHSNPPLLAPFAVLARPSSIDSISRRPNPIPTPHTQKTPFDHRRHQGLDAPSSSAPPPPTSSSTSSAAPDPGTAPQLRRQLPSPRGDKKAHHVNAGAHGRCK